MSPHRRRRRSDPAPSPGGRPTPEELKRSRDSLKRIGLALHNYHDANDRFPGDIVGQDGKPLMSWRVQLLPFLGEEELFRRFRLDEAWDSPANKKLVEKMPKVFAPIRVKAGDGQTFYLGFAGPNTAFEPGQKIQILWSLTDGTSNTAMVVEAGAPVVWTKPEDLLYDPKKPLPKLGGLFDGSFHLLLADGDAIRCRADFGQEMFPRFVTQSDGKVVNFKAITVQEKK